MSLEIRRSFLQNTTLANRLDTIDRIIWIGLIILVVSLIFSIAILQISIFILTLATIVKIYLSPSKKFKLTLLDIAVILFLLSRLLSIPVSIDVLRSAGSLKKTPFFIMTYFVVSRNLETLDLKSINKLFKFLILSAILVSILGIAKYFFGVEERVGSTSAGYTTLAIFLSTTFAFTLGTGIYYNIFKNKIIWALSLILMLMCLAFTFARAQWIATFVVILLAGIIKNKKILPIAISAMLILILISPKIRDRALTISNPLKYSSERTIILKGAAEVFPDRFWFGHGIGTFQHIFPFKNEMKDKGVGRWHNDYIQVFMESGFIGLAIFLNLIFWIFKSGISIFKTQLNENQYILKGITFGIILSLVAFFVQSFASGFLGDPISSILFWFFVATLAALSQVINVTPKFD